MDDKQKNEIERLEIAVVNAMDDLPILSRLKFVKNIVLSRGGDRGDSSHDGALAVATDVLDGVIDVLKAHPQAAQLKTPEP